MLLTAAAVVVGASVILTDPIFQGLALSLIAGAVASTFLRGRPFRCFTSWFIRGIKPHLIINLKPNKEIPMTVERGLRLMAGVMVLLSLVLLTTFRSTGCG